MATFTTDQLAVQSSISIAGDVGTNNYVIASQSGVPIWKRTTGLVSQYSENTFNAQNLNAGTPTNVIFYSEDFNFAGVIFGGGGETFTLPTPGLYRFKFECMIEGVNSRTAISFFLNGNYLYGGLNPISSDGNTEVSVFGIYSIEYIANIAANDVLTVVGQQVYGSPAYLVRNTVYNAPFTRLTIERLF